jgi:hypothetical protein
MSGVSQSQSETTSAFGFANIGLRLCRGVSVDANDSVVHPDKLMNGNVDFLCIAH